MKDIKSTTPYKLAVGRLRGTRLKDAQERIERLVERVGLSAYVLSETTEIPTELVTGPFNVPVRRFCLAPTTDIMIDPSLTIINLLNNGDLLAKVMDNDGEGAERAARGWIERSVYMRVANALPAPLAVDAEFLHQRVLMLQPYCDLARLAGMQRVLARGMTADERERNLDLCDEMESATKRDMPLFETIVRSAGCGGDDVPTFVSATYLWMMSRTIMTGAEIRLEPETLSEGSEYGALRLRGAIANLARQRDQERRALSLVDHDARAARVVQEFLL